MSKSKSDWRLQTKLEKCLLSSLIIVSVLLIGISVFVVIKLTLLSSTSCNLPVCISSANKILNNIDQTVNPCDDFFKFACGNLIKKHESGYQESRQLKERIKGQLEKRMKDPIQENDHYLVKNQKILFQSCMNQSDDREENLRYFKNIVDELNGWPLLDGNKWNETDWLDLTYKLRKYGLHYSSFFNVKVDSDPLNVTTNLVHINDPYLIYLKEKHKDIFMKYLSDSLKFLGSNNTNLHEEIEEIFELNKALNNISEKNAYNYENLTEQILLRRIKVKDFQKRNNQINWLNFINNLLTPVATITEEDYVVFPIQQYMDEFFEIINSVTNRVKINTIIWGAFDSLTHYFPNEIDTIERAYTCAKDAYVYETKTVEKCRNMLHKSFECIPTDMEYARTIFSDERKNDVKSLIKYVKSEFKTVLSETTWMDQKSKDNSLKKLYAIVEILGNQEYFEDPVLKMFENRTLLDENDSLLILYIKSRQLLTDMHYAQLLFSGDFNKYKALNRDSNSVNANYMADRNIITLCTGIVQDNFVTPEHSKYLNYGSLGTVIGHEMTHAFSKFASEYDETGKMEKIWTENTTTEFDKATQCILDEANNFEIVGTEKKMNASNTLEENLADFAGVKVAYLAYKKWVEQNGEELPLVGLNYTPYQLFWISAVLDYCYDMDRSKIENVIKYDSHAVNIFRVNAPLKHNADFAKDFNCPLGSPMNPSKKCIVF
ncbi:hypothetical protein FQR65_LT06862 [Abscondita terminalis]|nr:hypothetical protein FQR65_LT06862 [Abscondita terminalis]